MTRIAHNKTDSKTEQEIIELYSTGMGCTTICKQFKVHFKTVLNILRRYNIPVRDARTAKQKYHYNEDFFEIIDTEEKAYWLGFILADGCISIRDGYKKDLSMGIKDKGHLQKFLQCLNGNNKIRTYTYKNKEYEYLSIRCPKMVDDLIKLGITPRKSMTVCVPSIPDNLYKHFWRGVIDGDGSMGNYINKHRYNQKVFALSLVGNENIICGFVNYLKKTFEFSLNYYPTKSIFVVKTTNGKAATIVNHLYKDSSIFLTRKFEIAQTSWKKL